MLVYSLFFGRGCLQGVSREILQLTVILNASLLE